VAGAVHDVPVVLDLVGFLADQIFAEFADGRGARFEVPPGSRLAIALEAIVGPDADVEEPVDEHGLDADDFHKQSPWLGNFDMR
jgi:hypothetical protein